jgi:ATP-dependent protease ClpP protease subunit
VETIYLIGSIDDAAFKRFDMKLTRLENESGREGSVRIVLNSEGGSAYDALAFFDRIKASSLLTKIYLYGTAFSAAVLVLAAGKKRLMGKNAWVMVHEDTTDVEETQRVRAAVKELEHAIRLENQWCEVLAGVTKASAEKWDELHAVETYLSANQCLELGLIDEVL